MRATVYTEEGCCAVFEALLFSMCCNVFVSSSIGQMEFLKQSDVYMYISSLGSLDWVIMRCTISLTINEENNMVSNRRTVSE